MKKFSTALLSLALVGLFAASAQARLPQSRDASLAKSHMKKGVPCQFRKNAPDKHVVVKGDTLWTISNKFLRKAWCWPKVWGMNKKQVKDPHWIFPGQIVYFDRLAGRLRLGNPAGDGRLTPRIRYSEDNAIPTIDPKLIEPFMNRSLIINNESELTKLPRIVAIQKGRLRVGPGDRAYAIGDLENKSVFNVFRKGNPLKDPETGKVLGIEAVHLGVMRVKRLAQADNEAHAFSVIESNQDINVADYLMVKPAEAIMNYVPHPPSVPVDARIVSVYGDAIRHVGQFQVVTINRGSDDGIDIGTVLTVYNKGRMVPASGEYSDSEHNIFSSTLGSAPVSYDYWKPHVEKESWDDSQEDDDGNLFKGDPNGFKHNLVKLPDEESGDLFVFRVFDNISYAILINATDIVEIGDIARSPE